MELNNMLPWFASALLSSFHVAFGCPASTLLVKSEQDAVTCEGMVSEAPKHAGINRGEGLVLLINLLAKLGIGLLSVIISVSGNILCMLSVEWNKLMVYSDCSLRTS